VTGHDGRFTVGISARLGRGYVSGDFLWSATHFADRARQLEDEPSRRQQDDEHRSCVTASILNSAGLLEATINEWFDDVADGYLQGHVEALAPFEVQIRTYWTVSGGNDRVLDRYEMLFGLTGHDVIPKGEEPWQGARDLISLRNELMHAHPKSDEVHRLEKALRNRFPDNKLMADDTGHPWWPYHCLGAGCAKWSYESAVVFVERVADELGLKPKYRQRMRQYRGPT